MRGTSYELALESRVSSTRSTYRFETADGVPSKRSFRTAELLLLESLWESDPGRLLVPQAAYGVVGTVLAERAEAVHMTETSARAAHLCERNAGRNGVDAAVSLVADLATLGDRFDTVAYAPRSYTPISVGKQFVVDALSALEPDGKLYLAASKRAGLSRYEECLRDVAASVERVSKNDDCRVLEATRQQSFDPPTYASPRTICPEIDGVELTLVSRPGLFSASQLDDGTRLLLETATVEDGERVLDLCCGYGAIGTYAARIADCDVWLSDDDCRATACAERSLRASGVEGTVVTADCVEGVADRTFDRVLSNPPTHAGDGVLSELFDGAHQVLAPDGEFTLVHHRMLDLSDRWSRFELVERLRTGDEHVVVRLTR